MDTIKGIHIDEVLDIDGSLIGHLRGLREHGKDCNPGNCEDAHAAEFGAAR